MAAKGERAIEAVTFSGSTATQTMDIDRQRIAGVCVLEQLGYSYRDGEWLRKAWDDADTDQRSL